MKGFILGFLLALTLDLAAKAMDVQITNIGLRDLFAMSVMDKALNANPMSNFEDDSKWCYRYADTMMKTRSK